MKTEKTIFLSILKKDIPDSMHDKMLKHKTYTYEDTVLTEHLYSVESVTEKLEEKGIPVNEQESSFLKAIQLEMIKKDAAYFRVVEF